MRDLLFSEFEDKILAAELRTGRPYYAQERELALPGRRLRTVRHLYVWPAYRGRGYARSLVARVAQWADVYRVDLALYVARIGRHGMTRDDLIRLYSGAGFELSPGPYLYPAMVRRWQELSVEKIQSGTVRDSALVMS